MKRVIRLGDPTNHGGTVIQVAAHERAAGSDTPPSERLIHSTHK
jgi:uncharacterized Zn-binding protein involved in type VI secretion